MAACGITVAHDPHDDCTGRYSDVPRTSIHATRADGGEPTGASRVDAASARETEIRAEIEALVTWWTDSAYADITTTAPKAVEYGAADLEVMGAAMQHLLPGVREIPDLQERRARGLEAAVAFYALGKVARLFGAFEQGRVPNDDSWFDLAIYCGMARKIRATGEWV